MTNEQNIQQSSTQQSSIQQNTEQAGPKTILVIGGTGKTGSRVAERLTAQGLPVRVGSRNGEPPFVWEDPDTWEAALDGVGSVYVTYYPDLGFPGAAETVGAFSELAVKKGARRIGAALRTR